MRKVTREMVDKFLKDQKGGNGNTTVTIENGRTCLYLFGELIAYKFMGDVLIQDSGYKTLTTRERLSALCAHFSKDLRLKTSRGEWFLDGKSWDGTRIKIN